MRIAFIAVYLVSAAGIAAAQAQTETKQPDKSEYSTGRTITPETKVQTQPQGPTGPINTTSGGAPGAPASSPQGESPPGMQSAPEGSSQTVVEPEKK